MSAKRLKVADASEEEQLSERQYDTAYMQVSKTGESSQ